MIKFWNFIYFAGVPLVVTYFTYGVEHILLPTLFGVLLAIIMDRLDEIHDKIK